MPALAATTLSVVPLKVVVPVRVRLPAPFLARLAAEMADPLEWAGDILGGRGCGAVEAQ